MKRNTITTAAVALGCLALGASTPLAAEAPDPKALILKVVEEAGGADALRKKNDVEYTYVYRRGDTGKLDVSLERYRFDGEKSWGRYAVHENVRPDHGSTIIQGYDGKGTWQTVAGTRDTDPAAVRRADFLRKTNFYWFAMTFKLLDPGLRYTYEGRREFGGVSYELVRVTFDAGIGDVSDTYVLYINPSTWRIDRFLFTVLDFGKTDPFLMEVEHERVDGVLVPVKRRYAPSSWSGTVADDAKWTDEISVGIRFDHGFPEALFQAPR